MRAVGRRHELNIAFGGLDDLGHGGKAEARPVGFRGEEGIEDPVGHVGRDAAAIVGYVNEHEAGLLPGRPSRN